MQQERRYDYQTPDGVRVQYTLRYDDAFIFIQCPEANGNTAASWRTEG